MGSSSRRNVFQRLYALSQRKKPSDCPLGQPSPPKQKRRKVELELLQKHQRSQAILRSKFVAQARKAQAECRDRPQIDPFSRTLAGAPQGDDVDLATHSKLAVSKRIKTLNQIPEIKVKQSNNVYFSVLF